MRPLLALLALSLFLLPIHSAHGESSVAIGPQLGIYKAQDADDVELLYGAALRLKLASALGVETSLNYREESYSDGALTVQSWPVQVTGLLYVFPTVYGAVGAGWYNTTFDIDVPEIDDETQSEFGWHAGGGIDLPLNHSLRLAGDVRYVFLDYEFEDVPGVEVDSNFYMFAVSLLINLGAHE